VRKNFGAKPLLYPQPVFIIAAYGEDGTPNAMNAAWGGITEENEITICISAGHKTTKNILSRGAFTVSMADVHHVAECDYLGVVSGNDTPNKLDVCGFHTVKSDFVDAPIIEELPMAVECRLKSYDENICRLVGEIVNVSADERVLNEKGKVDPSLLKPITFDPMNDTYVALGETVGKAFCDGLKLK
jgi:flavin reductase (DIM6/NTAB) family NADH-FMN oxidoreductase RutF